MNNKDCCSDCFSENQSGSLANNWKGGISELVIFLRNKLTNWKKESIKNSNYKCVITGNKFDDIHHLYPFNKIVEEIFLLSNLDKKVKVSDYLDDELEILVNLSEQLHFQYPLGVCLTRDMHNLFHETYGKLNNTPEQFYEFLKDNKI